MADAIPQLCPCCTAPLRAMDCEHQTLPIDGRGLWCDACHFGLQADDDAALSALFARLALPPDPLTPRQAETILRSNVPLTPALTAQIIEALRRSPDGLHQLMARALASTRKGSPE